VIVDVLALQRVAPEQAGGEAGNGGVVHSRATAVFARHADITVDAHGVTAPLHDTAGLVHRNANGRLRRHVLQCQFVLDDFDTGDLRPGAHGASYASPMKDQIMLSTLPTTPWPPGGRRCQSPR